MRWSANRSSPDVLRPMPTEVRTTLIVLGWVLLAAGVGALIVASYKFKRGDDPQVLPVKWRVAVGAPLFVGIILLCLLTNIFSALRGPHLY